MDAAKFLQDLVDGDLGDHIRGLLFEEMLAHLASDDYDEDREWADGVHDWIRENWY